MPAITKLSKKQQKANQFKKGELKKDEKKKELAEKAAKEAKPLAKPKPKADKKYILFVGNLPYELEADELKQHFSTAKPANVRMRKGFAFLDFDDADSLHVALRFHHSTLKYRKINVELTAGGGGNSKNRRAKLEKKNKALQNEMSERIEQEIKEKERKKEEQERKEKKQLKEDLERVHPSRRKAFKNESK